MPSRKVQLVDVGVIERGLSQRAGGRWAVAILQMVLGAGLSFVGPVVMTMLVWFTLLFLGHWVAVWKVFGLAVLVMMPLAFWTEHRTRGNFLTRSLEGSGGSSVASGAVWVAAAFAVMTHSNLRMTRLAFSSASSPAGLSELMLWGPRQLMHGIAKWSMMRKFVGMDGGRIAVILQQLLARDRGVPLAELEMNKENREDIIGALAYLSYFDWVGISENGDRAWALTETREEFGAGGGQK